MITRSESGKTFRQIRTGWSQAWEAENAPAPLKMPYQDVLVGDLLGAIEEHDIEPLIHSGAGQSVGYFDEVRPVSVILNALRDDAIQAINGQTFKLPITIRPRLDLVSIKNESSAGSSELAALHLI